MILLTEQTYQEMVEEFDGFCQACGAEVYGIEPDAKEYECEECGYRGITAYHELFEGVNWS